jgi:hypothetical protein
MQHKTDEKCKQKFSLETWMESTIVRPPKDNIKMDLKE